MSETRKQSASDAELIARSQQGDVDAFGQLYERHLDRIYRYIRVRVAQDRTAEDITEMVFLRSFEAIGRYEERGNPFSAYLYQVARNLLVDHYRRAQEEFPLQKIEGAPSDALNSEELTIERERIETLAEALERLPEDYQEVIRLRVLLQMPTREAAQWMERSDSAVRVLLHRAMKALKKQAEEIYET